MATDPLGTSMEHPGSHPARSAGGEPPSSPRLSSNQDATYNAREGTASGLDLTRPGLGAVPIVADGRPLPPSVLARRGARVAELVEVLERQAHLAPGLHSWLDRRLYVGWELAFYLVREQLLARSRAAYRRGMSQLGVAGAA